MDIRFIEANKTMREDKVIVSKLRKKGIYLKEPLYEALKRNPPNARVEIATSYLSHPKALKKKKPTIFVDFH